MAANHDFFLNFGSNADTWADELERQLRKPKAEIASLQTLLTSLETQAAGTGRRVTAALAGQVGGERPTAGAAPIPGSDRLMANMVAASGELDHILDGLKITMKGLEGIPNKVSRGISSAVEMALRQVRGEGPSLILGTRNFVSPETAGSVRVGSDAHRISQGIRDALNGVTPRIEIPPASLAAVSATAIDKAGVDRIVTAIRAQTRVIAAGIPVTGMRSGGTAAAPRATTGGTAGTRGAAEAVESAAEAVEDGLEATTERLEDLERSMTLRLRQLAEVLKTQELGEAGSQVLASLESQREAVRQQIADRRAAERKLERETTGITRGQQGERSSAEALAAKKARETITADELRKRRELEALVNSPGASDFDSRLNTARTAAGGNYSRADLDRMVEAYREVGIIVERNSKTSKRELADRLKAANVEYRQQYPEGAERFRTTGFNVTKTTQVDESTAAMLGGMDRVRQDALELSRAFDVLDTTVRDGSRRLRQVTERALVDAPGAQVLPPGMVKGRRETGAGQREGLPFPLRAAGYDDSTLDAALADTRASAQREMKNVLEQAKRADFDPYDARHGKVEAGTTPEEQRLAQTIRNRVRDTRLATQALDSMGQEFFGLRDALAENTQRAGNLRNQLLTATKNGQETSELEDDYRAVSDEIENIHRRLQQIPRAMRDVFETTGYKEGLERREGRVTDPGLVSAQGFYRTAGAQQASQKRDELRAEIATAEKIQAAGTKLVKQLNADAAKGLSVDTDAFSAAMDEIEQAERALPRLRDELRIIDQLFEQSADGAERLADRVGGMGSRQAFEARKEAMQNKAETFSDWRDLNTATGASVAGGRTAMGSRATSYPLPNTVFNGERYLPRGENQWSKRTQTKLDSANTQYIKAQLDFIATLERGDASAEDVDEAQQNFARAANLLANRLARLNEGIAPSFQHLTGFDPAEGSKEATDELRRSEARAKDLAVLQGEERDLANSLREARRALDELTSTTKDNRDSMEERISALPPADQAEARRLQQRVGSLDELRKAKGAQVETRAPGDNAAQRVERASLALETATRQHARAQETARKVTERLAAEEAQLAAAYEALSPAAREQYDTSNARLKEVERARSALNNAFLIEDPAARSGAAANLVPPNSREDAVARAEAARRSRIAYQGQVTRAERSGDEEKAAAARMKLAGARMAEEFFGSFARGVAVGEAGLNALLRKYETNRGGHAPGAPQVVPDVLGYPSNLGYAPPIAQTTAGEDLQAAKDRLEAEAQALRDRRDQLVGSTDSDEEAKRRAMREELELLKAGKQARIDAIAAAREEGDLKENAGYHAARDAEAQAQARMRTLESKLSETGGVAGYEQLAQEAAGADREVARLAAEVEKAQKEMEKGTRALQKRTAALQKERDALAAQGPYKKGETDNLKGAEFIGAENRRTRIQEIDRELKQLGKAVSDGRRSVESATSVSRSADNPDIQALRDQVAAGVEARRQRTALHQRKRSADAAERAVIQDEINELRQVGIPTKKQLKEMRQRLWAAERDEAAAGGSGGGGRGGSTAAGGADGGDHSILGRILAKLIDIHNTLKSGVNTVGGASAVTRKGVPITPVSQSFPKEEVKAAQGLHGEEARVKAEIAQERRRLGVSDAHIERAHNQALKINERLEGQRAVATNRSFLEQEKLQRAMGLTTRATQDHIAQLTRLISAGASEDDINRQRLATYRSLERDLKQQNVQPANRTQAARTIFGSVEPSMGTRQVNTMVGQLQQTSRAVDGFRTVDQTFASNVPRGGVFGEQSEFTQALFGNAGFWSRVMNSTGTFVVRNFTAGFVFGLTNALQDVIYQGIITESTFIRVSDALEQTGRATGNLRTQLQGISSAYGVALNDVYMTAAGLTGLFDDIDDIAGATKVVAELQAISMGALTASEAMGVLASITGAYSSQLQNGTDGLNQVADVLTVIQNTIGTNIEVTGEGVASLSGLAAQLKIDFQDMAVYVGQIAKLTNQTGAAAGEQFSRILASMQTGRGRAALTEALPDSGIGQLLGQGEYGAALRVLMENWDGLSETQQRNLGVTIAGQRQMRAFQALMADTAKTIDTQNRAHNANGEAQQRAEKIAETLNGQLQRLGANLQNLAQNLVRTGILNFFGVLLQVTNGLLSAINKVFSVANDIADSNPFLKFMKDMMAGLLGLILTLKLGQAAFIGFRSSMREMRASEGIMAAGVNAAAAPRPSLRQGAATGLASFAENRAARAAALREEVAARTAPAGTIVRDSRGYAVGYEPPAAAPPRTFAVGANGVAEQERATRAAGLQARANSALAASSRGAAAAAGAVAGMGLGATAAIVALTAVGAAWIGEMNRQKDVIKQYYDIAKQFSLSGAALTSDAKAEQERREYVGPATELMRQNYAATTAEDEGFFGKAWNAVQSLPSAGAALAEDPLAIFRGEIGSGFEEYFGLISDEGAKRIEALDESIVEQLEGLNTNPWTGVSGLPAMTQAPTFDVAEVEAATGDINKRIAEERRRIVNSKDLDERQRNAALAAMESLALEVNDALAAKLLAARGIAEADALSSDQIKQIDQVRGMLTQIQSSGIGSGGAFGAGIDALVADTGVREGSDLGRRLERLAEGNLTRVEAMRIDAKVIREQAKNLQAKYLAATTGENTLDAEQVDEIEQQLIAKMTELATITDQIIQGFVDESVALATAAANRGNYGNAAAALDRGLNQVAAQRDRDSEAPDVRARRDALEAQQAQQSATYRAQGMNARLNLAKARNQGSVREAQIEAQITQNEFFALRSAQAAAQMAGRQGPPREALRQAKIAWVQAELAAGQQAQQLNIAEMVLAAAGLWNGMAGAQAQEAIALQQWRDAKANFGAKSLEALGAQTAYVNQQKTVAQTGDQVAQAQRDAALAAIPQGNAVAVAQQGVANAQAALAAASKYGTNSTEYQGALAQLHAAQQQAQAAQSAVAVAQAQLAQAYADARGDAVASARAGVAVARASLAAALAASGGAASAEVLAARAQLVGAFASVQQAQADLVQSQYDVSIALAEASGNTVQVAVRQLAAARAALRAAWKRSGGRATAEVNAARAEAIRAEASLRDARLQDELDTINFNLEMGRITQSSAIAAMQEILRTHELTKQQRRDLLLQIKGMKEEMSDSQWNFGDIKLPTPYQMRRYIEDRKRDFRSQMDGAAARNLTREAGSSGLGPTSGGGGGGNVSNVSNTEVRIQIDGADVAKVRKIIREEVGRAGRTMTTQSRRR